MPETKTGIMLGLGLVGLGCLILILVAYVIDGRDDELELAVTARSNLEQQLREEREKYRRDMNGALEEIHTLRTQPDGPADTDAAGELPTQ